MGGLDWHVITTEYRARVHCIHMLHPFYNALVHVIYSGVSGQCSHTIESNSVTQLVECFTLVTGFIIELKISLN